MPVDPRYPHTYKKQREYERAATQARAELIALGQRLPKVCGYTYMPRSSRRHPDMPTTVPTICQRSAGSGTTHRGTGYCDYHEVQAELETSKAPKQLQKARQTAHEQAKFFGISVSTDPHQAILDEINRTASIIEWLNQKMSEERERMAAEGINPDEVDKAVLQQYNPKTGFLPSVWMTLFKEEREHLIRTSIAAIKAGIAERRVRIAEDQGRMIAAMMMAFIHDSELALTPNQIFKAPEIIRKHLLALPANSEPNSPNIDPLKVIESEGIEL